MAQRQYQKPIGKIEPERFIDEERELYHLGSERAFLACLMLRPDLIVEAENSVTPDLLHFEAHRYIYQVMLWIYRSASEGRGSISFDPMSLLGAADQCVAMGDPTARDRFLSKTNSMREVNEVYDLIDTVNLAGFRNYVQTIRDRHARVMSYRRARVLQQELLDLERHPDASDVAVIAGNDLNNIASLTSDVFGTGRIIRLADCNPEWQMRSQMTHDYPEYQLYHNAVPGFPFWHKLMGGGFARKGLTVIAARAKTGKTTLLMHLASEFAKLGYPVLYIDNEMSALEIVTRQVSNLSRVPEHEILTGRIYGENNHVARQAVDTAVSVMAQQNFYYVNVAGQPPERVVSVMREFHHKHVGSFQLADRDGSLQTFSRPALVIFDWLKLPDASSLSVMSETQSLGFLCSAIKDTAARLDLPVIAGAQGNREAVGKDPDEFIDAPEKMIANSDRIAMFCTQLCILRNLTRKEEERLREAGYDKCRLPNGTLLSIVGDPKQVPVQRAQPVPVGVPQTEEDGRNSLLFNQFLHVVLSRGGRDYRKGIPLFINRGRALYEEVTPDNHQTTWEELSYIRERVLKRRHTGDQVKDHLK